ncbi:MAG: hypothetical protein Ct9H90mP22_3750 [Gammaproteobacteria bacterium]|nr:MAG: hypothetical protein Ct9H90mP22_3750 [Gammaproteobacteria bacterium]
MKNQIRYFIAGIFIGISELLPGISGATVALMFGVYERILAFLTQLKGFNLIIPLLIGMVLSIFLFSSLINYLYENFTDIFNILIAILMIGYGVFLIINIYLKENISQGMSFYVTLFLAIFIGLSLSSFQMYSSEEPKMILLAILVLSHVLFYFFQVFPEAHSYYLLVPIR